jgi:hypothetical protein
MHASFRQIAAYIREKVAPINWIDRDKGQLEKPTKFNSIITPGALISFSDVSWEGLTRGNQIGLCKITVKLIFPLPVATHEGAQWSDYTEFEDLSRDVFEALSSHKDAGDRRGSSDYYTDEFYVCEQTFDFTVYESKTVNTILKPAPEIEGTLSTTINIQQ